MKINIKYQDASKMLSKRLNNLPCYETKNFFEKELKIPYSSFFGGEIKCKK